MASLVSVGADPVVALAAAEAELPHRVHPTGWGACRVQDALLIVHRNGVDGPIESWLPCSAPVVAAPSGAFGIPARTAQRLGLRGPARSARERAAAVAELLPSFELPLTRGLAAGEGGALLDEALRKSMSPRVHTAAFELSVEILGPDAMGSLAERWVAKADGPPESFEAAWSILRRPGGLGALAELAARGPSPEVRLRAARILAENQPRAAARAYLEPLLAPPVDPLLQAGLRRLLEELGEEEAEAPARDELGRLLRGLPSTRSGLLDFLDEEEASVEDKAKSLRALALGPRRAELLPWVRGGLLRPDGLGWTAVEIAEMWADAELLEAGLRHSELSHAVRALDGLGRVASWARWSAMLPGLMAGPLASTALAWAVRRAPDAKQPLGYVRTEALGRAAVEGARTLGLAGVQVLAQLLQSSSPSVQRAAAEALRGMPKLAAEDLVEILDGAPTEPRISVAEPELPSLARFQHGLRLAVESGIRGRRVLRRMASTQRVPVEIRVQALRHLARDLHPMTRALLESTLLRGSGPMAEAALGSVMQREDLPMETVRRFVETSREHGLRARAIRFAAARWPKTEVRELLEGWLLDSSPLVRRAALDGLFRSLRLVSEEGLEARLVNLMEVHTELEVRRSAALALGSFGGQEALAALQRAVGSDVGPEAMRSLRRLRAFEGGSGPNL
ncbi:MAG: HEAT repeat domain-containing protein [Myxococcota bacterium]